MKDEKITIRVDAETRKELEKLALKDDRNLSDYIRVQLKRLVEENKKKK
jgi:hypothetical protein